MFESAVQILAQVVWLVLAGVALSFLLRLHNRTGMKSFLWLIAAVIAWPLLSRGIWLVLPSLVMRSASTNYLSGNSVNSIYGVVVLFDSIVEGTLLLIAVIQLERELTSRMLPATPTSPPAIT